MKTRITLVLLISLTTIFSGKAQEDSSRQKIGVFKPYKFFAPSPVLNKPRVYTITGAIAGLYTISNIWWSSTWYSQFEKDKFHFFNDASEWLQMDKAAHAFNAYFLSRWGTSMYRWAGVDDKKAMWIGFGAANAWQLSIEIQDAFSERWGFSLTDLAANIGGSLIYIAQEYLWQDQRFTIKMSAFPVDYPEAYKERTDDLYGNTISELLLKDYNAMTFWVTATPRSFIKRENSKFPKWIGVSFGYGAHNLYGGFSNTWEEDGVEMTADIDRIRQFYLSADIDWTKIPVKSNAVKTLFQILNIVKLPFPAVEFNTDGSVEWKWLKF